MKKSIVLIAGLLIAAAVVFTIISIIGSAGGPRENTGSIINCRRTNKNHLVLIANNQVQPRYTAARVCDTLTIKNTDPVIRLVAFGEHDHHTPYDGTTEKVLGQNQSLTVTLDQKGNYEFHDHLDDAVQGTFTVR